MKGQWTNIYCGDLALRSWWVDSVNDCKYVSILLPEVFGINNWIRSFSEKLAQQNVPVLALPLYGRTAPNLDLEYSEEDLKLGRHHKNLTTLKNIIDDVSAAINWVKEKYPSKKISIIGFCFGGHAAFIASSLKGIESSLLSNKLVLNKNSNPFTKALPALKGSCSPKPPVAARSLPNRLV